ncbi:Lrp/AsnC family transcriptional regulator [Streptomyces sp. NBC_00829]|uniref:Lrp/AsnC family transcriptional regulator n=1 Tax=Streptomyces sp. NBC_00829 TaxID=2903679 RepID=UPI00386A1E55|nr:Lrp/AsnC family transcriptional regulator [Streptomyces sp. NBC_00829]
MTGYSPDATDWRILQALQSEGRATFAELARAVSMSASAVTERVRRLEEAGVEVSGKVGALGSVTTSVVYSSPLPRRAISR